MSCQTSPMDSAGGTANVEERRAGELEGVTPLDPRYAALEEVRWAAGEFNFASARLAEALHQVKAEGTWKPLAPTFREFVSEGLQLKPALANELVRIVDKLDQVGVTLDECAPSGFHKLAIVARHITPENRDDVLTDMRELDAPALKTRYAPVRKRAERKSAPRPPATTAARQLPADLSSVQPLGQNAPPEVAVDPELDELEALMISRGAQPGASNLVGSILALALIRASKMTRLTDMQANLEFIAREFLRTHPAPAEHKDTDLPNSAKHTAPKNAAELFNHGLQPTT